MMPSSLSKGIETHTLRKNLVRIRAFAVVEYLASKELCAL